MDTHAGVVREAAYPLTERMENSSAETAAQAKFGQNHRLTYGGVAVLQALFRGAPLLNESLRRI